VFNNRYGARSSKGLAKDKANSATTPFRNVQSPNKTVLGNAFTAHLAYETLNTPHLYIATEVH